jgi:secondary thiamine-phosphate synthase enzyme
MEEFQVTTSERTQFVDITDRVQRCAGGNASGMVAVFVPHTTAGITINESADPDVMRDVGRTLDRLVPWDGDYRHAEGNSAAHIKCGMMGSSVHIPVSEGRLQLGTWQAVYFCEFDGPRQRRVWVCAGAQG